MALSERGAQSARDAPRRRGADPNLPPFSGFLERDQARAKRQRSRRRTILISVGLHLLAVVVLLVYSMLNVDELFGPAVEVKIYAPAKLPTGVKPLPPPPRLEAPPATPR